MKIQCLRTYVTAKIEPIFFPDHLDLPGGKRDGTESPFETFQRELDEEFGLNVTAEDILYARVYPASLEPQKIAYFVVARLYGVTELDIKFGDEGVFVDPMRLSEFLRDGRTIPAQTVRINDYLDYSSSGV